ncbi:hypothetical protein GW796_05975 [archaeon]|nr:hypothetical protein [archaeon]NCQ51432.1 hypothetical protein [archaeon]NCT58742.1 hypothetical protein [archaeon]
MKVEINQEEVPMVLNLIPKTAFFSVGFIKKDGTNRNMTCRFGVKKYLNPNPVRQKPKMDNKYKTVFDVNAKGYRHINAETIFTIKSNHVEYVVK